MYLVERYGQYTRRLSATDNIIPMKYFQDFLPTLAQLGLKLDIFYETKANLKDEQLRLYAMAGLNHIQPGIESFSTPVLKLNAPKGTSALQNIRLLRQCKEHGIRAYWNYIFGFPGEKESLGSKRRKNNVAALSSHST